MSLREVKSYFTTSLWILRAFFTADRAALRKAQAEAYNQWFEDREALDQFTKRRKGEIDDDYVDAIAGSLDSELSDCISRPVLPVPVL